MGYVISSCCRSRNSVEGGEDAFLDGYCLKAQFNSCSSDFIKEQCAGEWVCKNLGKTGQLRRLALWHSSRYAFV